MKDKHLILTTHIGRAEADIWYVQWEKNCPNKMVMEYNAVAKEMRVTSTVKAKHALRAVRTLLAHLVHTLLHWDLYIPECDVFTYECPKCGKLVKCWLFDGESTGKSYNIEKLGSVVIGRIPKKFSCYYCGANVRLLYSAKAALATAQPGKPQKKG